MAKFGTNAGRDGSNKKREGEGSPDFVGLKTLRESVGVTVSQVELSAEERARMRARLERMRARTATA